MRRWLSFLFVLVAAAALATVPRRPDSPRFAVGGSFHVFAGGQQACTFETNSTLNGGGVTTNVGYYYHQDNLGSSTVLSDPNGVRIEISAFYPFGRTQTANPQAGFQVSRRFTGQILDAESGLYYCNARYYDPELGRFIQADTIIPDLSNPQSYNRYSYCINNPLRYTDPTGHAFHRRGANGLLPPGPLAYLSGDTLLENLAASGYNVLPEVGNILSQAGSGLISVLSLPGAARSAADEASSRSGLTSLLGMSPSDMALASGPLAMEAQSLRAIAGSETAAEQASFSVASGKWDYFFGRVTSGAHNQARSLQNLKDLEAMGITEANGGQARLMDLFRQGLSAPEVSRYISEYGTTITRAVQIGKKGIIEIKYYYPGGDLAAEPEVSTIIPKVFEQ